MKHGGMTLRAVKLAVALVTGILLVALAPVAADASSSEVIYKNIPNSKIGLPALGFESDSVSEFGGAVKFGGTDRTSPTVYIDVDSYACQSGSGAGCTTAPGATFEWPITLNVYELGSLSSPILTLTKTFHIHYRPKPSAKCPLEEAEDVKGYGNECAIAKQQKISWSLPGVTLPSEAILAVAFNTDTHGKKPTGEEGPYDALNVAINADYKCTKENPETKACEGEYVNVNTEPPSVGSDPAPNQVFVNSTYNLVTCGGPEGTFGESGECWKFEQPAFEVKAKAARR